jgi:hypothetical protein
MRVVRRAEATGELVEVGSFRGGESWSRLLMAYVSNVREYVRERVGFCRC